MTQITEEPAAPPADAAQKGRHRRLLVASALLVAIVIAAAVAASRRPDTRGLVCEQPGHDFGMVPSENTSSLSCEFLVENESSTPIHILKKMTSCGCTSADLPTNVVPARGQINVIVKPSWAGRDGQQAASVTLVTDRETSPILALTVSALVTQPIVLWPQILDFSGRRPGLSEEQTFRVGLGMPAKPFTISDVRSSDPSIKVRRVASAGETNSLAGGPGTFAVRVVVPRKRSKTRGEILISTSLFNRPIRVSVFIDSPGSITTSADSIVFTGADPSAGQHKTLTVHVYAPEPSATLNAAIVPSSIAASFGVDEIAAKSTGADMTAKISIGCTRRGVKMGVATLRLTCGPDSLDIPLILAASGE
ncbi:MAG TPA: DUF1573 domain-containing protein [Tepidisphaeraceae bacterium]|nr:DUF1573 domain-containing protein [Tepidisphaeraceae bacterium]